MRHIYYLTVAFFCIFMNASAALKETLPPLENGLAPQTYAALWADFDPRREPLDVEILKEWEEDGVVLQVLRYRVGVFKGQKSMIAAVYGYPKGARNLPGLVQIHGGGQYADSTACLTNAKRGYATISIAWAGRINAPDYRVTPREVKLFWEDKTDDPNYKITTDWGALDGYHAPSRNGRDAFASIPAEDWTLDAVVSPRNNSWFLCTMAARRALTFLEQQSQVDANRLGVYGHSMGGKLTVLTTGSDDRVKAAAPSCGGISDRFNASELHRNTVGDGPSLARVDCPILFLSPSNDFHGLINDLPNAIKDLGTKEWRLTVSPHHNHQDTAEYEVASQLWFDQHFKGSFRFPETPQFAMTPINQSGNPTARVQIDNSQRALSVDVYYTQQGKDRVNGRDDSANTKNRFWRHAKAVRQGNEWVVELTLISTDLPLWAYANVSYPLEEPVRSAGYYYGVRTADQFVLSSELRMVSAEQLQSAGVRATLRPSLMIEDFEGDWRQEWFNYRDGWARSTHKVYDPQWKAPEGAKLALQVSSEMANTLVVKVDDYASEVPLDGGSAWEAIELSAADFKDVTGAPLASFAGIKELRLSPQETLRDKNKKAVQLGGRWQGSDPVFNDLHWVPGKTVVHEDSTKKVKGQPDTMWTYKEIDGKELQLSVFLPDGYASSSERFPTFVVYHGGSWAVGEANWHYPDCAYWASRGMIAVSVDYRLSKRDGVKVPLECVKDAKSAVRFLRKHAESLKVDPNKMVIAGGSAGGQLAAAMATLTSPETNDNCYDLSISCMPNAVILYNPYFKCEASLSPPNFLRPDLPPFITFLGDLDPAISVENMVEFHEALKALGNDSEFYVGKGGKHGLCNGRNPYNPYFYWSLELEDQFLVKHGILDGESLVARPDGVKILQAEVDYESYL